MNYLDKKFLSRQPIFKNYIQNNTSIGRQDHQLKKLANIEAKEAYEEILQEKRSNSVVRVDHEKKLEKIKPWNTIRRQLRL